MNSSASRPSSTARSGSLFSFLFGLRATPERRPPNYRTLFVSTRCSLRPLASFGRLRRGRGGTRFSPGTHPPQFVKPGDVDEALICPLKSPASCPLNQFVEPGDVDEALALVQSSQGLARAKDLALVQADLAIDAVVSSPLLPARRVYHSGLAAEARGGAGWGRVGPPLYLSSSQYGPLANAPAAMWTARVYVCVSMSMAAIPRSCGWGALSPMRRLGWLRARLGKPSPTSPTRWSRARIDEARRRPPRLLGGCAIETRQRPLAGPFVSWSLGV